jgi:hypothetical protein
VTLCASGDSETSARLVPACPTALWREPTIRDTLPHHIHLTELVFPEVSDDAGTGYIVADVAAAVDAVEYAELYPRVLARR